MKLELFLIKYVQSMPDLFENVVPIDGNDVLRPVIVDDFLKRKELTFINPRNGKTYHRHYALMPQGGVAVLNVGKFVDGNFVYASVGINLSCHQYEPYILIGCHHSAFSDIDLIASMVKQSINWALADTNMAVKLEVCHKPIAWEEDILHAYFNGMDSRMFNPMNYFGFELLEERYESMCKRKARPHNSHDIQDYLMAGTEEVLLTWLHNMVDDKTHPKDMMRPVRALIELKRSYRILYDAFIKEFGKARLISRTTYNDYINLAKHPYFDDGKYAKIKHYVEKYFDFCIKE